MKNFLSLNSMKIMEQDICIEIKPITFSMFLLQCLECTYKTCHLQWNYAPYKQKSSNKLRQKEVSCKFKKGSKYGKGGEKPLNK